MTCLARKFFPSSVLFNSSGRSISCIVFGSRTVVFFRALRIYDQAVANTVYVGYKSYLLTTSRNAFFDGRNDEASDEVDAVTSWRT